MNTLILAKQKEASVRFLTVDSQKKDHAAGAGSRMVQYLASRKGQPRVLALLSMRLRASNFH